MKSKYRIVTICLALLFALCALVALSACNRVDGIADPPTLEHYSQREHIGWSKSISNFQAKKYADYYNNGSAAFIIPGLNKGENFVLQGIEYYAERNWALLCGYISPKTDVSNSVIFVIDMNKSVSLESGEKFYGALIKEILLNKADGKPFTGHAGGIAVSKNYVWIANGGGLYSISLSDIVDAPASSYINLNKAISVPVGASYCAYTDGVLWVGEFELAKEKYTTDETHHKDELTAWTVGYVLNENGSAAFDSPKELFKFASDGKTAIPDCVLWHGSKVQGMTVAGNKILLSTSYGRKNDSKLYVYDNPIGSQTDKVVQIGEAQVPCYVLDNPTKTVLAPPMLEDLSVVVKDGKYSVLVANESGSYNYHGANAFNQSSHASDFIWEYRVEQ